jgi:predicted membrane channel-forming protein YqfA (hemolysin III family)
MTKPTHTIFALALGTCLGWLLLLETGWIHTPDSAGIALVVSVIALAVALVWYGLKWLERWGARQER